MTIPIAPGPFSFLEGAGEAAGSIAQVREERKRHGEEIAHKAANDIISQIQQGLRPASVLKDPEVKKLFAKAYGVTIPDAVLPQPKEDLAGMIQRRLRAMTPGGPAESAATGLPSEEVARAGESQAKLKGAQAEAALAAGAPALEAGAAAAKARAEATGATFNQNVYEGATALLGTDPAFKKLAEEAASGVLDYRLRSLALYRENLSLERQQAADNVKILHDMLIESAKRYDKAVTEWQNAAQLSGDGEAYKTAHPKPSADEISKDYLKTYGLTPEEFQTRLHQAMAKLQDVGKANEKPGEAGAAVTGATPTPSDDVVSRAVTFIKSQADVEASGRRLAMAEQSGETTDLVIRAILVRLKEEMPGSAFRKLNNAYQQAKTNPRAIQ